MMRWVALFCCLLAAPALGQEINVRSGAHDGFTRLVLDVPAGTIWSLEAREKGARLTLDGHQAGFDTSNVFARIDRSFVSAVSADQSGVTVDFSCDCSARVFTEGPRMIVMDVFADPEKKTKAENDALASAFLGDRPLRFAALPLVPANETPDDQSQRTVPALTTPLLPLPLNGLPTSPPGDAGLPSDAARLKAAQEKLVQRIANAATQGLLSPSSRRIELPIAIPGPQVDTRIFDSSAPASDDGSALQLSAGNLRITSSSDIPFADDVRTRTATTLGLPCVNPDFLDVATWGSEQGLSAEVAASLGQLYGEFDRLVPEVAIRLARTYIHYGFGLEARHIISLSEALDAAHPELVELAEIMEYGHVRDAAHLKNFADCNSAVALWAVLSMSSIEPSRKINVKASLLGLSGLPMHLRSFIAPELSRRLLAYGDEDGAAAALRSLERTTEPLNANANLAKADLEMAQGDVAQAQDRLEQVVSSNAEQSAEALIKLVESHLDADIEIEETVATLVEAYAMEMRDDPIGDDLRRTHVQALGKSGQFSAAFDALSRVTGGADETPHDMLRSSVLELLARNADDAEFLDHAFRQMTVAPETMSAEARFVLAKRLTNLGFPKQAEAILLAGPVQNSMSKLKTLRAEIALALFRPSEALVHLYGVESEAASILRAQAEAQVGDFADAHAIYTEMGDSANSARAAWLSGEWSLLVEETAPVFGPVVQVAQSTLDDASDLDGMLERTQNAIRESREARQIIGDLLNSEALGVTATE